MSKYFDKLNIDNEQYDIRDTVSGYITGIDSEDVTDALGYIPQEELTAGQYINIDVDSEGHPVISSPAGDYNNLDNKPTIDGHTIEGDMTAGDLINFGSIQVSSFINDVPYLKPSDLSDHNTSSAAHADIRQSINNEVGNRESADASLQEQIDALASSSDVIDILGSYEDLSEYDTSHVKENDIIKVIQDETRDNAVTYYRWLFDYGSDGLPIYDSEGNHEGYWDFIGEQGPYYTAAQADDTFVPQTRNINGHDLSQDLTLHYSDFGDIADDAKINDTMVIFKKNADATYEYDSEGNLVRAIVDANSGQTVGIITLNQSGQGVINYNIPTNVNELDGFTDLALKSNYYTKSEIDSQMDTKQDNISAGTYINIEYDSESNYYVVSSTGGDYNILDNKPSINSHTLSGNISSGDLGFKTSDIENDSGYLAFRDLEAGSYIQLIETSEGNVIISTTAGNYNNLINTPTKTSQFINDGDDGVHKFLSIDDVLSGDRVSVTETSEGKLVLDSTTVWGDITGDLSSQTDVVDALALKQDNLVAGTGISIDINSEGDPVISNTNVSAEWGHISGTLNNQTDLKSALDTKVDKVDGKQLSTEDFTTTLKTKLDGIDTSAQVNVLESVSVNNKQLSVSAGKNSNIVIAGTTPINVTTTQDGSTLITHADSGVTSGSKGDTTNQTPSFGDTFKVTSGTVDIKGHTTAFAEHTVTIPNAVATSESSGLMSAADKALLDTVATDAQENVIEVVEVNGTPLTITNKTVDVTVPTALSDLTDNVGYALSSEVADAISDMATQTWVENKQYLVGDDIATKADITYVDNALDLKQDVLTSENAGSGIEITSDSEGNVTISNTNISAVWGNVTGTLADQTDLKSALDDKVDKVTGKGLSTNDFTDTLKTKLDNISSGAQVNVIEVVKRNGTALTITDKTVDVTVPTKLSDLTNDNYTVTDSEGYVHTDNNFTDALKNKLDGIASGAEVNVQANWNESDTSSDSYIQNKPSIPSKTSDLTNDSGYIIDSEGYVHTDNNFTTTLKNKLDGISANAQVNVIETVKRNGTALTVTNKAVDISVPTKLSDLNNDNNTVTDANYVHTDNNFTDTLKSKLDNIASGAEVNVQSNWSETDTSSDTYIQNKPSKTSDFTNDGNGEEDSEGNSIPFITAKYHDSTKQDVISDLSTIRSGASAGATAVQPSSLATVATSGSYNDLSNKPTIPAAANNAALTIQKNGSTVATFTANASTAVTANISVPTKTSDLTNEGDGYKDSEGNYYKFITSDAFDALSDTVDQLVAASGEPNVIEVVKQNGTALTVTDKTVDVTVPTKLSDLNNDNNTVTDANYVHTDNNFTSTLKTKLDNIASNAEVNVQADWNETSTSSDAYIKNKPSIPSKTSDLSNDSDYVSDASYVHTDNNFTSTLKTKLDNIASNAQVNVIETVKVNGTALSVSDKAVDVTVPTKLSDLSNDNNTVTDASYVHTDNNFTSTLKTKLDNIASNAQVNVIETVKVNGTALSVSNKAVDVTVPTKTSELTNDGADGTNAFITATDIANKVDKVSGKGLSTNDFTDTLKTKLDNIASNAQVNVIETVKRNGTALTVTNKTVDISVPTKLSELTNDNYTVTDSEGYVHTDNNFTDTLKSKLDNIESGAEVNVQADWSVTNTSSDAYIKNKPTIPTVPSAGTTATAVSTAASGGSATTWSKSDHVHSISSSTITSALGFTPYSNANPSGYQTSSDVSTAVGSEATARENADIELQNQIDAISAASDVVDVVGTYVELQAYDTTKLHNNDIVKVLVDSTHSGAITYYRWLISSESSAWSYIGAEGPYYTVSETDTLLTSYVPTSRKVGAVDLSADVALSGSFSGTSGTVSVSGTPSGSVTISTGTGTTNYTPAGSNQKSAVTISPKTTSVYSITSVGSKTDGTAASFTQGTDSFTANTPTAIDTTKFSGGSFTRGSFSGGSFTQGTDSFTANTPTAIDTTKFSGGSFTRGSFSGGSFTQGTDTFTANTPTAIDTSKFSGGSFTRGTFNAGSFTQGSDSFTAPTLTFTPDSGTTGNLKIAWSAGSFTQGSDTYIAPSHGADSFTAASLQSGFYTAGTAASFTQGTDNFTAATHGSDSFTAAQLKTGFYTAGTAASFTQGTDNFTAATHGADSFTAAQLKTGFYTAGTAASFEQGTDSFTANTPTAITLPSRSQVSGLWNGYNTGSSNTYADAQPFSGTAVELKGSFSGSSLTSTGSFTPSGNVTVTASH